MKIPLIPAPGRPLLMALGGCVRQLVFRVARLLGLTDDHSRVGHLSASVGLVEFHPDREKSGHVDSAEIVARRLVCAADSLLLEAKRTGKNKVVSRAVHCFESTAEFESAAAFESNLEIAPRTES